MKTFTILVLLLPASLWAKYTSTELFVIGWGSEPDRFIAFEGHEVDPGTPDDSTDDYPDGESGPSTAFVDSLKNIIIVNPQHGQCKGFNSEGNLIFDLPMYTKIGDAGIWSGDPYRIYVDNSNRIYTVGAWNKPLVFITNYGNMSVDTLTPVKGKPEDSLCDINWTYDGKIMFYGTGPGWITYDRGEIIPGGSWGVKLDDDRFYSIKFNEPDEIIIFSDINPDIRGKGSDRDSVFVDLNVENVVGVELLNSMEPTHLYLAIHYFTEFGYYEVWKCDFGYNPIDIISPPPAESYYKSTTPRPFITADGDIYEFRACKDGLHVISWTKK